MPFNAIEQTYRTSPFSSEPQAANFLSQFSDKTKLQIIAAMYIGRDHLHKDRFDGGNGIATQEALLNHSNHISPSAVAGILAEKGENAKTYFERFISCARNGGLI